MSDICFRLVIETREHVDTDDVLAFAARVTRQLNIGDVAITIRIVDYIRTHPGATGLCGRTADDGFMVTVVYNGAWRSYDDRRRTLAHELFHVHQHVHNDWCGGITASRFASEFIAR